MKQLQSKYFMGHLWVTRGKTKHYVEGIRLTPSEPNDKYSHHYFNGMRHYVQLDMMQWEVNNIYCLWCIVLPKMLNLNLIKPLALTCNLQEIQGLEERVKHDYKEAVKPRTEDILQDNWPVFN